jgi:REP element-mobilizing transposase RayT
VKRPRFTFILLCPGSKNCKAGRFEYRSAKFTQKENRLPVSTYNNTDNICLYMSFFNSGAAVVVHRGKLPHWRQEGVIYFVTFHLADSLPQSRLEWFRQEKKLWLRHNPEPHSLAQRVEYYQRFTKTVDRWLDAGYGRCILAKPACKTVMESSLLHFDGVRYELGEFIVMPNYVHAIVSPTGEHQLTQILHNWKSFSAHQFNRILGSNGQIWHRESFDHIVRSERHLAKFEAYIRNNPGKK